MQENYGKLSKQEKRELADLKMQLRKMGGIMVLTDVQGITGNLYKATIAQIPACSHCDEFDFVKRAIAYCNINTYNKKRGQLIVLRRLFITGEGVHTMPNNS